MAKIRAFQGIRPQEALAGKIAALPYDVYNTQEARAAASGNPYSFLHVDKAEIDLPDTVDLYDPKVYEKASENLTRMLDEGWLIQDSSDCLYIYQLEMAGRKQTGLVALASIDEYLDGTIKKHEFTREDKEQDRIRHIEACNAQTGPIFLAYKARAAVKKALTEWTDTHTPVYSLDFDDGTKNTVWVMDDRATIDALVQDFAGIEHLFIADGHHRNAAAVKVGLERRKQNPQDNGAGEFNSYLSVLFSDDELWIMDYNRVVKDLAGLSKEALMERLSEDFDLRRAEGQYRPEKRHCFGLYIDKQWYAMTLKEGRIDENDPLERLDVSILQALVLEPIFDIHDIRTNKRIDFIGGIRGLGEIEQRVDSGEMAAGFAMYPTSMQELMAVAEMNEVMPPKSTWFEPKLRSGLFIHKI